MRGAAKTFESLGDSTTHGRVADLFRGADPRTTVGVRHAVRRVEEALLHRSLAPTHVGRYALEELIGSGGAGVVYRAHDPRLGRRVALKLLRPHPGTPGGRVDQRLLAEARALASVEHDNVIEVFDVGLFDDHGTPRIYLVMEWIEGSDLGAWRREQRPSPREIIDAYIAACRGLAAVHAHGVLHRDFKPANVLRDRNGVVKVADFGLAEPILPEEPEYTAEQASADTTLDGVLAGTPRYMAPEQHMGMRLDAAADQYAFCVALFEALVGTPPFRGDDLRDLAEQKQLGPPPIPRLRGVPPGIADAIARGMRPDPERRFASMLELADELESCVRREDRRGSILLGVVAAGTVLLGLAGAIAEAVPPTCSVEDIESRPPLRDRAIAASLDAYAQSLQDADVRACDVLDDERRAAVQSCLDHRRDALRTLVATVDATPNSGFLRAAVRDLPAIDACSRRDGVPAQLEWQARRHLDGELLPATVLQSLGRYDEALERVEALRRRRGSNGSIEVIRAELLDQVGRTEEAASTMEAIFFTAVEGHDARTSAAAAMALVGLSYEHARFDDALRWSEHARSQLYSLEPLPPSRRIAWLHNTAMAHFWAGDIESARTLLAEADGWLEEETLVTEIDAAVHGSYGTVLLFAGEPALALEQHTREIEIRHGLSGNADPDLVGAHLNEGNALQTLGRDHEALEAFATAESLALGRDDMDAVSATLSRVRMQARIDPQPSLAFEARHTVEGLAEAAPAHRAAAGVVAAEVIGLVEGCEAAIDPLTTAVAELEHAVGAQHHAVGSSYAELGVALRMCGREAEGRRATDRALEILRAALPDEHPWIEEIVEE